MDGIPLNEITIIEAARQGDLEAFNTLVLKYQELVYNQAYWLLNDAYQAEDLAQETFLQAYRNLAQFRGGSFQAWLVRIVTNACLDVLRKQKRQPVFSLAAFREEDEDREPLEWLPDPGTPVEELVEQSQLSAEIQHCLDELSPADRAVLVLVDILEFDYSEAASTLGIPVGTLKSRLSRARLRLRDRLERTFTLSGSSVFLEGQAVQFYEVSS